MPAQRSLLETSADRGSAIAAVAIGGWLLLTILVEKFLGFISIVFTSGATPGLYGLGFGPGYWLDVVSQIAFLVLPAVAGFFVAWRFVLPITAELSLMGVIKSSVVAASFAAAVYFVVRLLLGALTWTTVGGSLFGNSFPVVGYQGPDLPSALLSYLFAAILALMTLLPPGVLAGILLQRWLRRHGQQRRDDV